MTIINTKKQQQQQQNKQKHTGWVSRRKEEKAKTIDEIHKEVAKEEQQAKMQRRTGSMQNLSLRRSSSLASTPASASGAGGPPSVDADGFVQIPNRRGSVKKIGSKRDMVHNNNNSSNSSITFNPSTEPNSGGFFKGKGGNNHPQLRRSQSQPASMSNYNNQSPFSRKNITTSGNDGDDKSSSALPPVPAMMPVHDENTTTSTTTKTVPSLEQCATKTKTLLKEYFVGGDTDDAVLSVDELVNVGLDGSVDRGAKVIESGTLLVMEMKELEVTKFITIMKRSITDGKLPKESIIKGLYDPLEFLYDIEIDAPLAGNHLATIIVQCLQLNVFTLHDIFSKESVSANIVPEHFLSGHGSKPASFCIKILSKLYNTTTTTTIGGPTEDELKIVESIMSDDEREQYNNSAKAMWENAIAASSSGTKK